MSTWCPVQTLTGAISGAVRGAGGSNCQVPVTGAVLADADAEGFGVIGGAAVWLEAVPRGAPVLGATVPQAATVSATVAPRIRVVNAGTKPADERRIVDHFFVRLPTGHAPLPARGRAAAVGALTGPFSLWLRSCPRLRAAWPGHPGPLVLCPARRTGKARPCVGRAGSRPCPGTS
jgi:hypothetical protein